MNTHENLAGHVNRWIRRSRVQRSLRWTAAGLAAGAGAALVTAAYALASLELLAAEFLTAAGVLVAAGAAAGFCAGLLWPVDRLRAARRFDVDFDLKERVSTALEWGREGRESPLREAQAEDALAHAAAIDPAARIPLRVPLRGLLAAAVLLGATAVVWTYGQDRFRAAEERRQTRETILAEAERIEALIEEIRANEDLTEEQKEDLLEPLEQALADLQDAETLEQAYSALEEAEEKLQALENPEAEALAEGLQSAGEELAQDAGDPLEPFAEHLADGDLEQAAEDLREVDAAGMEQAERERLAQQLESLADALESVDPELAETLREAAEAAREGDTTAAEEALEQAAERIEELAQEVQVAQAAGDAADELGEAQAQIVQAGQEAGDGGTPTGIAGIPAGDGGGEGAGEGGGEGSGAGEGSSDGGDAEGGQAGQDPIGQGNNPDGTGESDFQPISPSSIGGEGSDWVAVPPSGVEGDNVTGTGPSDPGNTAPITVPYTDVLQEYQAAVNEAIDSGLIPPQYRDIVRDYFSSLEP